MEEAKRQEDSDGSSSQKPVGGATPESAPLIRDELLRHPVRAGIVEALADEPGLHKRELARRLDVSPSQVVHHIERLAERGLIVTRPAPETHRVHCFRVEDAGLWTHRATRILFGPSRVRELAEHILEHPGATTKQLADEVGVTVSTIRHHLRSLTDRDLIEKLQIGRRVLYRPLKPLMDWSEALDEVGPDTADTPR